MSLLGRRVLKSIALVVAGFILLIGIELAAAVFRDYPLKGPEKRIRGTFGDPSLPPLKFVVLGDSTSVGVGTTPENSFAWVLGERLGAHFRVTLEVLGVPGATMRDVAKLQVPRAVSLQPDLVLIEAGANDTTHVTPLRSVQASTVEAVDRLQAAGIDLVVAGPPHMGTSRAFAQPLRALSGMRGNAVMRTIRSEVTKRRIPYIDLAGGTQEEFSRFPAKYYSSDWFHPGQDGYRLWAEVMYPAVLEAARRTSSASS